jgi:hypothetical protein
MMIESFDMVSRALPWQDFTPRPYVKVGYRSRSLRDALRAGLRDRVIGSGRDALKI